MSDLTEGLESKALADQKPEVPASGQVRADRQQVGEVLERDTALRIPEQPQIYSSVGEHAAGCDPEFRQHIGDGHEGADPDVPGHAGEQWRRQLPRRLPSHRLSPVIPLAPSDPSTPVWRSLQLSRPACKR